MPNKMDEYIKIMDEFEFSIKRMDQSQLIKLINQLTRRKTKLLFKTPAKI